MGQQYEKMVLLDVDVGPATRADRFAREFPDRFVQFGCAEQNMISAAAGIASMGFIPVLSIFACFCSKRAADQVSISIALARSNVKLCGCYAGLTTPNTGATHQAIDDVNIMRGMPNMVVIEAADAFELEQAMKACLEYGGPTYLRIVRCALDRVLPDDYRFQIGKAAVLQKGEDISIVASGLMVSRCLEAARALKTRGFSAEVINVSTIKPIDVETIVKSAQKTGCVLTAENHSIIGGLGSATAEMLGEQYPVLMRRLGINDQFGTSGQLESILEKYGLTTANIVAQAQKLLEQKSTR
jgi:transketolase